MTRKWSSLRVEALESRDPGASAILAGGALTVTGTAANDHLLIRYEGTRLVVLDQTGTLGSFDPAAVTTIAVNTGAGNDLVRIASNVLQAATIDGGTGKNILEAGGGATTITNAGAGTKLIGGSGTNTLTGGAASEKFIGGSGSNTITTGGGSNDVVRISLADNVTASPADRVARNNPKPTPVGAGPDATLSTNEVSQLLRRAAAASASEDAIIAIVDRGGRILGVRTEGGVAPEITGNTANLVFAIDGAIAKARTGAFFGNAQAPLTSRTIRNLSQTTISEREVVSNPNAPLNSTLRGPGFVAPVGIGAHFPPNVPNTPEVDLFAIEHTNRDGSVHPGADGVRGTGDDIALAQRFNIDPAFVPAGQQLAVPDSYGFVTGLLPNAQSRGIATLPGGIPIFKNGTVAGGIGVFFPGKTGFASEENSSLSTIFNSTKLDRSLESEYIAFAALGGIGSVSYRAPLNGATLPAGIQLPAGRIDLVGIQLEVFGPGGFDRGPKALRDFGFRLGVGNPDSGVNRTVSLPGGPTLIAGLRVPEGWLVTPHAGVGISANEVRQIIQKGIDQANKTRAAIRLPAAFANPANATIERLVQSVATKMVFAVCDLNGNLVGLFRMPDATVFSIDVAVAKSRNVNYYANPAKLQAIDRVPGVAAGTAFTNRTFRFVSLPRFPSAVDFNVPGTFSILRDGNVNPFTARQDGQRLQAGAFKTVLGHDAFFPASNFRDPTNIANQNGIVFFPGSAPLYRPTRGLIGGFGVSGDGVDQDDVVTAAGQKGFDVVGVLRADQVQLAGNIRLPYQKFNRNPEGI